MCRTPPTNETRLKAVCNSQACAKFCTRVILRGCFDRGIVTPARDVLLAPELTAFTMFEREEEVGCADVHLHGFCFALCANCSRIEMPMKKLAVRQLVDNTHGSTHEVS